MINNNHKNSACGFSDELVSYLYDEATDIEKTIFKAHLDNCSICADELSSFSGVHFSINDWKQKEFVSLKTPIIDIPYQKHEKPTIEVSGIKVSWLSGLRDLFALSPRAWSMTTASVVVLAVCVGIALFVVNSRNSTDIAGTDKTKSKPMFSPTAEKTPPPSNTNVIENVSPDKQVKPNIEPKSTEPEVAGTNGANSNNNRVVKVSNNQRPSQRPENVRKNNETNNKNKNIPIEIKTIEDDEEDNTLRLAEMFDEIDTK